MAATVSQNAIRYTRSNEMDEEGATSILQIKQSGKRVVTSEQPRRSRSVEPVRSILRATKPAELEGGLDY